MNAVPLGAKFLPQNQDPTRAPSSTPGATALPDDFLRPFRGYNNIQMWDYSSSGNYHALQMGVNRRFDRGFMFSAFYVRAGADARAQQRFRQGKRGAVVPVRTAEFHPEQVASWTGPTRRTTGRTTSSANFVYQMPAVSSGALGVLANDWQISGIYRWSSGVPYPVTYSIPGITARISPGTTARPARASWSTATRVPDRATTRTGRSPIPRLLAAAARQHRQRVGSVLPARSGVNNLDLSFSKRFRIKGDAAFEIRFDLFNALNHTQWTGVNNTIQFRSLTDPTITNLPYDSSGNLVNQNGFGTITGVRPPRTLQLVTRFTF